MLRNAEVLVTSAERMSSCAFTETSLKRSDKLTITYPQNVFISVTGGAKDDGYFFIGYKMVDVDEDAV